jgi:hypothetical protein
VTTTGDSTPWVIEEIENPSAVAPRDQPNSLEQRHEEDGNEVEAGGDRQRDPHRADSIQGLNASRPDGGEIDTGP